MAVKKRRGGKSTRTSSKRGQLRKGLFVGVGQKLLLAEGEAAGNKPIWIHVATEGEWAGHPMGPLDWDREFFDQVVANFRAHPQYKVDAAGVGCAHVVPYDYEHASEYEATSGTIPLKGAPAPAWAVEVEVRDGEQGAELWALTDVGSDALAQLQKKEYQFTSVAIWPNAVDGETNKKIGPKLTSIAFTNHPFIAGLTPIAAREGAVLCGAIWIDGEAESPEEMLVGLSNAFGLDAQAEPAEIREHMSRLVQAVAAGEDSLDPALDEDRVRYLVDEIKRLLGMPTLATIQEIETAVGQFIDSLSPPQPLTASRPREETAMDPKNLKKLAKLLKCEEDETAILMAAEKAAGGLGALQSLMDLFGSTETQSLVKEATKAIAEAKKGEALVGALTHLAEAAPQGDAVEEDEEEQAARVAASIKGLDPKVAVAVVLCIGSQFANLAQNRQEAEDDVDAALAGLELSDTQHAAMRKTLLTERRSIGGDAKALAKWREEWPAAEAPASGREYLKMSLVTGPNSTQVAGKDTGRRVRTTVQQRTSSIEDHPLNKYPGKNRTEKAIAYLTDKQDGFKLKDFRTQNFEAGQYLKQGAPPIAANG